MFWKLWWLFEGGPLDVDDDETHFNCISFGYAQNKSNFAEYWNHSGGAQDLHDSFNSLLIVTDSTFSDIDFYFNFRFSSSTSQPWFEQNIKKQKKNIQIGNTAVINHFIAAAIMAEEKSLISENCNTCRELISQTAPQKLTHHV